jgi:diguanylate cyclase (GGDEF)-like protein
MQSRLEDKAQPLDGLNPRGVDYKQGLSLGFFRFGAPVGAVLLVPSLLLALRQGDPLSIGTDCAAFALLLALRIRPIKRPLAFQLSIVALLVIVGSFHFIGAGVVASGPLWLCSATAIATVFFGLPGGMAICGVEGIDIATIYIAGKIAEGETLNFIGLALNTIGISLLIAVGQAYLMMGMNRSIEAHGRLASELEREAAGRHEAETRADFLETHDQLTRLPNRESFELELDRAIVVAAARGRILGVMTIGLDRFKRISETRGPAAGDVILAATALRLGQTFRDDDLIARSGGDMFLVLLSDMKSPDDVLSIITKARGVFDRSFSIPGAEIGLSASFGLALYPSDERDASALIRQSEVALHLAKENGPGSFRLYDAGLNAHIIEESLIEHEMRGALLSDAFLPWYQPKVDVLGRIVGVEALARWALPEGGIRQPDQFIRTAESSGCIYELGRIVLAKACTSAVAWEKAGLEPIPVSVNLSPYQFRSDGLVKDVRAILSASGLAPSRLDLEITESGIMEDSGGAIEKLAQLKALGCSISIDDFGTGYSSFSALHDFPVDCLKLPQVFVDPLPSDKRATAIAQAVIDLAHRLSFSVVAEGVENRAQFSWLEAARCDQYQGFLFSRPLPEAAFGAALAGGLELAVE